jgi:hypothetical protein
MSRARVFWIVQVSFAAFAAAGFFAAVSCSSTTSGARL